MSFFDFFFKDNDSDHENPHHEESLNKLLRDMEREHFARTGTNYPDQIETAYDVIALINGFSHHHGAVYVDERGISYYKTKFGFKPATIYNQGLANSKLHSELKEKEKQIEELKRRNEKLVKDVNQLSGDLQKEKQQQSERTKAMLIQRFSHKTVAREAKPVITWLTNLEDDLKKTIEANQRYVRKSGQGKDQGGDPRQLLIKARTFNDALEDQLLEACFRIVKLKERVLQFIDTVH